MRVQKMQKQDDREERIIMEIVVDAYDEQERAMGWFYYLADIIQFPLSTAWVGLNFIFISYIISIYYVD